jgi:tetratricopeptide (TPR) repeat protein
VPAPDPSRIEELVASFLEAAEQGDGPGRDAFLATHTQAGEALARALDAALAADALFPAAVDTLPERLGAWRALGELGRGGMGRILRAEHDERPGEVCALKLLHVTLAGSERALERFRREGEALTRLDHPGLVRVVEVGLADGHPFLAMELVEGESLASVLARARDAGTLDLPGDGSPQQRAAAFMASVAEAVAAAHAAGVLHRDLNPANILLRADGSPVVIDFGLVRTDDAPTLTATGDMLGTPQYMPPEQARGERVDERSDVWALGAVLSELLTLQPPRASGDTLAVLRDAGVRPLAVGRRLGRDVPADLARVVVRALRHAPASRTASAAELAADLRHMAAGEPALARSLSPLERLHDLWLMRRVACVVALVTALVAGALMVPRGMPPEERDRLVREAHHHAAEAWLDGDNGKLAAAAASLAEVAPQDPWATWFASAADGSPLVTGGHAGVTAFARGAALLAGGDSASALQGFEAANNTMPNMPVVLVAIVTSAQQAGDTAKALDLLERIAFYVAGSREVHRMLAELYLASGRAGDAVQAAGAGLALAPDVADLHLLMGEALVAAGDSHGARRSLDQAHALPDFDAVRAAALERALDSAP